jgi:hypothetical protein
VTEAERGGEEGREERRDLTKICMPPQRCEAKRNEDLNASAEGKRDDDMHASAEMQG